MPLAGFHEFFHEFKLEDVVLHLLVDLPPVPWVVAVPPQDEVERFVQADVFGFRDMFEFRDSFGAEPGEEPAVDGYPSLGDFWGRVVGGWLLPLRDHGFIWCGGDFELGRELFRGPGPFADLGTRVGDHDDVGEVTAGLSDEVFSYPRRVEPVGDLDLETGLLQVVELVLFGRFEELGALDVLQQEVPPACPRVDPG